MTVVAHFIFSKKAIRFHRNYFTPPRLPIYIHIHICDYSLIFFFECPNYRGRRRNRWHPDNPFVCRASGLRGDCSSVTHCVGGVSVKIFKIYRISSLSLHPEQYILVIELRLIVQFLILISLSPVVCIKNALYIM